MNERGGNIRERKRGKELKTVVNILRVSIEAIKSSITICAAGLLPFLDTNILVCIVHALYFVQRLLNMKC